MTANARMGCRWRKRQRKKGILAGPRPLTGFKTNTYSAHSLRKRIAGQVPM